MDAYMRQSHHDAHVHLLAVNELCLISYTVNADSNRIKMAVWAIFIYEYNVEFYPLKEPKI